MEIAVLLWSPDISGGTNVIFEHAKRLKRRRHKVYVITDDPVTPEQLDWHSEARDLIWKTYDQVGDNSFDIVIATWWKTALYLHRVNAKRLVYFVQSIESYFYPAEEKPLRNLVESTYTLPVSFITEASWIKRHLDSEYGRQAYLVRNGIQKEIYKLYGPSEAPRIPGGLRVLIEGPLGVHFKNVERTVELCRESEADELWLLTSSAVTHYAGVDQVFSRVPVEKTAEIYRSCDVIVKLSRVEGMFGPPLEMFHCGGTAITYDVTGHDEYLRDKKNAFVLPMEDEVGVVDCINRLKRSPELLNNLKAEAISTAENWPAWEQASLAFEDALTDILAKPAVYNGQIKSLIDLAWRQYDVSEQYRLKILDIEPQIRFRKVRTVLREKFPKLYSLAASYWHLFLRKLQ